MVIYNKCVHLTHETEVSRVHRQQRQLVFTEMHDAIKMWHA